jgi:hypothetical protein
MPFLIRNRHDRATVQLAHASAMRSTNEIIDQLQAQVRELQGELQREREQRAFDCNEYEGQVKTLLRDLLHAKYQLAKLERERAFVAAPSPSAMVH